MDIDDAASANPVNAAHSRNPQRHIFFNAKTSLTGTGPGMGSDGAFRDPWGNPYRITLDLNYDGKCDGQCTDPKWPNGIQAPVGVWTLIPNTTFDPIKFKGVATSW